MNKDIVTSLRPAVVMTLLFALLLGLAYPLAMTGIGQCCSRVRPMAVWWGRQGGRLDRDRSGLHLRPLFPDRPRRRARAMTG
jgi:hypothetical protein